MFRRMNKKEIEIKKINGLRMVQFYEISGVVIKSGVPDGMPAPAGCSALAVYYGDNKRINMNETEAYYELLVNRIYELYNALSDAKKSEILMNEYTRSLLDSGVKTKDNAFFAQYYGMTPVDVPELAYESSLSKRFASVAEYLAESISKATGSEICINKRQCGWRGAITLSGLAGEEKIAMHCRVIKENDGLYVIFVTNFLKTFRTLTINAETDADYINLVYESDDGEISGNSRFIFEEEKVLETHSISFKNDQIFYENIENPIEKGNPEGLQENQKRLLPDGKNISCIYTLPWNTVYVRYSEEKSEGEIEIRDYSVTLLSPDAMVSETRGRREVKNNRTGIRIKTDSFFMRKILLSKERIQTYFVPKTANSNGKYREKLEGRVFIEEKEDNTPIKKNAEKNEETV